MKVEKDKPTQLAIIYKKTDGKIVRVSTLTPNIIGKITESDLDKFLPGIDLTDFAMVFIQGKQYLDIERYRVDVDAKGTFLNVVEKIDVLSSFEENTEVTKELLDREANIVISVLGVIDDKDRLAKYKELEERGQNRTEIMNFFKQRGI
jgi:hypothetical protein